MFSTFGQFDPGPWDVDREGKRFLMIKKAKPYQPAAEALRLRINIVLNWFEELKQRVPVP